MDCIKLYNSNPDFREYVNKYAAKREIPVDVALSHLIVKEVAKMYGGD